MICGKERFQAIGVPIPKYDYELFCPVILAYV